MFRRINIQAHKFLEGPNIYDRVSGLFATVSFDEKDVRIFREKVDAEALGHLLDVIREVFPVAQESEQLSSPDSFLGSDCPAAELVLAVVEILIRDFCVQPKQGSLLALEKDNFKCFIPCDEAELGFGALELALIAVQELLMPGRLSGIKIIGMLQQRYLKTRKLLRLYGLNQSTIALARAAQKQGVYYHRLFKPGQFLQLGQGVHLKRIMETSSDKTSLIGRKISSDKFLTVSLLKASALPTAGSRPVASMDQAKVIASELGYPLVVKPRSMGKGKGVVVNIRDEKELFAAIKGVAAYNAGILIERHIEGDDHRLLVVGGKFVAAAKRLPALVVGDGNSSVGQLVEQINRDPRRGMNFERLLEKIELDEEARQCLAEENMSPDSVPQKGQTVKLRGAANISRGGTSIDVTEDIHPDNRLMAERAARLVGLDVAGIDFFTPDITRSWRDIRCAILEVNSTPGLRPHLGANPDRDVAAPIIEYYFPEGCDGRIPTVGITGSLGKTTTSNMVANILSAAGMYVARSTTQGSWNGIERIRVGDVAGGRSGAFLMRDPAVDAGVFELSRGGLIKVGMGIDSVDIGTVLNVQDNHVGLDGIMTREELAKVKSLVVQNARKLAVLNADDPLCLAMRDVVTASRLCLVSKTPDNVVLKEHQTKGGLVVYLDCPDEDNFIGEIMLFEGQQRVGSMPLKAIGSSLGGRYRPAVFNALFAIAIAHGLGVSFNTICKTLCAFESTNEMNPGRMNSLDGFPFQLYVTWADGPVAYGELARFAAKTPVAGKKYLVFSIMGNRPDTFVLQTVAAVAGAFDYFICCDWDDLRGRSPGEIPALVARGLIDEGVDQSRITATATKEIAVEHVLSELSDGDLAIVVTFGGEAVWNNVERLLETDT